MSTTNSTHIGARHDGSVAYEWYDSRTDEVILHMGTTTSPEWAGANLDVSVVKFVNAIWQKLQLQQGHAVIYVRFGSQFIDGAVPADLRDIICEMGESERKIAHVIGILPISSLQMPPREHPDTSSPPSWLMVKQ